MLFITLKWNWVIPGAATLALVVILRGKQAAGFLLVALATVILNDWLTASVLKPLVGRPRPCEVLDFKTIAYACSHSFSFPSNHASNSFTLATLFALWNRNTALLAFTLALLVSFSRVYLGMHYPSDVLAGALCGIVMGWLGYRVYRAVVVPRLLSSKRPPCPTPSVTFSSSN